MKKEHTLLFKPTAEVSHDDACINKSRDEQHYCDDRFEEAGQYENRQVS